MEASESDKTNGRSSRRTTRLRKELQSLHEEMEIAEYRSEKGQRKRLPPKSTQLLRTQKRKKLEKVDAKQHAIRVVEDERDVRLRGAKVALEDDVVHGSLIFGGEREDDTDNDRSPTDDADSGDDEIAGAAGDLDEMYNDAMSHVEILVDGGNDEPISAAAREDINDREDPVDAADKEKTDKEEEAPKSGKKRTRFLYRLRSFKSYRMAQRHGDALGAHARGLPRVAIEKLGEVASDAPAAPQIYSSLGMVYENQLNESLLAKKGRRERDGDSDGDKDDVGWSNENDQQLVLAKKAYGSYHIAAVLCKKDFTLWVRAADTALQIADLYTQKMELPTLSKEERDQLRGEKQTWTEEAKNDLTSADNQKPPGIDVAAKLAETHMALGHLSEALTILTDLKNKSLNRTESTGGSRKGFEWSYKLWILYADLMLRIGHECTQWNEGIETNNNYMFRRWLRKYSTSFDWRERRLQALCLALETAAGSKSCSHIVHWTKERVNNVASVSVSDSDRWFLETEEGDTLPKESTEQDNLPTMAITTSESDGERESDVMDRLSTESDAATRPSTTNVAYLEQNKFHHGRPISASCATVCNIASELMKHCLEFELYDGGRLIGEAVSRYMKERSLLHEKRLEAREDFAQKQQRTDDAVLLNIEPYDEIAGETLESDDDQSVANMLSDDEDISKDNTLLDSLGKGMLPPEIRVLYAVSLIGEGGRNYVASKCIESVNDIRLDSQAWLDEKVVDTSLATDPKWQLLRETMLEPLKRTAAFALVSDILRKTGREEEWSNRLERIFQNHVDFLGEQGFIQKLFTGNNDLNARLIALENNVLKIMLTLGRMTLCRAESLLLDEVSNSQQAIDIASNTFNTVTKVQSSIWNVQPDASISPGCIEILGVQSRSVDIMLKVIKASDKTDDLESILGLISKIRPVVSLLCGVEVADLSQSDEAEPVQPADSWNRSPLPSVWQSSAQEAISRLVYNLCVACSVSLFSGWEQNEFNLELLKKRGDHQHFGVNIRGDCVSGYVATDIEEELRHVWKRIGNVVPWASSVDFAGKLSTMKNSEWYETAQKKLQAKSDSEIVAAYGEEAGLRLLVKFCSLCLDSAALSPKGAPNDVFIKTALSVVLPLTQFLVEQPLWDSPIGTAAAAGTTTNAWRHFSAVNSTTNQNDFTGHPRLNEPQVARPQAKSRVVTSKKIQPKPSFPAKFVRVPTSRLLYEWKTEAVASLVNGESDNANQAMKSLDVALRNLRSCFTTGALQKASIRVAASLLDVVLMDGRCRNPFLCLQQAVVFAAQGARGGNNDESFKQPLPAEKDCLPLEALVIVGRADCLQAIDFPNEAIFLCSYVTRVCSLHRDENVADLPWTSQWKVIAIYAYNVSAAIDSMVRSDSQRGDARKLQIDAWDKNVLEELDRGKADAISLAGLLSSTKETVTPDDEYAKKVMDDQASALLANLTAISVDSPDDHHVSNGRHLSTARVAERDNRNEEEQVSVFAV